MRNTVEIVGKKKIQGCFPFCCFFRSLASFSRNRIECDMDIMRVKCLGLYQRCLILTAVAEPTCSRQDHSLRMSCLGAESQTPRKFSVSILITRLLPLTSLKKSAYLIKYRWYKTPQTKQNKKTKRTTQLRYCAQLCLKSDGMPKSEAHLNLQYNNKKFQRNVTVVRLPSSNLCFGCLRYSDWHGLPVIWSI